jgi:hypothetical protein
MFLPKVADIMLSEIREVSILEVSRPSSWQRFFVLDGLVFDVDFVDGGWLLCTWYWSLVGVPATVRTYSLFVCLFVCFMRLAHS